MATMTYVPISELDAVNIMLESVGEAPVSAISSSVPESELAQKLLHNTSREVQSIGLLCNTEYKYQIALDGNSKVAVADNILRIDGWYRTDDFTARGGFVYDRYNQTYVFSTAPYLNVTWFLPFTSLTHAARNYITIKAARKFQKRYIGSDLLDAFTQEDEYEAKAALMAEEMDNADLNILHGPDQIRIKYNRR